MAEAVIVLAMIITTFSLVCALNILSPLPGTSGLTTTLQVDQYVNLRDTRYKVLWPLRSNDFCLIVYFFRPSLVIWLSSALQSMSYDVPGMAELINPMQSLRTLYSL